MEKRIREVFCGLGSRGELPNGFRMQRDGKQTVAVYFSGNLPGNAVEIGLNAPEVARILGKGEHEVRSWITEQAAATGRERERRGQRGIYPGLACGSERDLEAFLSAYSFFREGTQLQRDVSETAGPITTAIRIRIEKAAIEAGFDLKPERLGNWLVFRSAAFSMFLGVAIQQRDSCHVGISDDSVGGRLADEFALAAIQEPGPWAVRFGDVAGYESLCAIIRRAATIARVLADDGVSELEAKTRTLPDNTEVFRLVRERVGQDIFRQRLVDYWSGKCSVTSLDVKSLLRASHIKPWKDCDSDEERLDVFNGLLLAPHLDALFDGGWVTFDDQGYIGVAEKLSSNQRMMVGVNGTEKIEGLTVEHRRYLEWHRNYVFQKGASGS